MIGELLEVEGQDYNEGYGGVVEHSPPLPSSSHVPRSNVHGHPSQPFHHPTNTQYTSYITMEIIITRTVAAFTCHHTNMYGVKW